MHARRFIALVWGLVRRTARWFRGPLPCSLSEELVPRLFVRRLEERCVLNGQSLVVIVNSTTTAPRDTVLLTRQNDQVDVYVDGTLAAAATFSDVDSITLVGADKPDTFDIDFSGGNPIPPDGLTLFGGGQPASSDNNSIVLQSAPAASPISSLVNQPIGFGQGSLQLQAGGSGGTIGYTRVNFIEDTVATQSAVLDNALSGDSLVIGSPPGGDQVTVTSAQAPTVAFTVSPDSLTVDTTGRTDPPADAIDIQSLQSNTPMNLTVQTAAGDTIGISGTSDLYGGNLSVTGSSIQIAGTFTSGGQTYNGPVELQADAELASTTAGDITFNGTVDGAHLLDVETAGTQTFNGTVGGQTPLAELTADATSSGGSVQFNMATRGGGRGGRRGGFVDVGRRGLLQYRQ